MSRPRSIFAISMLSVFHFQPHIHVISHITSFKQTYLFYVHFLEYLLLFLEDNLDEEREQFLNSKSSASGCCLDFALFFANFSLALLIKVLIIKKACISSKICVLSIFFRNHIVPKEI